MMMLSFMEEHLIAGTYTKESFLDTLAKMVLSFVEEESSCICMYGLKKS